jgi:hypothetical protein
MKICDYCGEYEVIGAHSNSDGSGYCSDLCDLSARAEERFDRENDEMYDDGEPQGSYDLSDDADALASAGFGTDEDYGYYGDE